MRTFFSPHGTEWQAETYEEAIEQERDALAAELARMAEALRDAIQVIEWCGANDKTPTYTYDPGLATTARVDGSLPGAGKAFNTPREYARYWPDRLRGALSSVPQAGEEPCPACGFAGPYNGHVCEPVRCGCGDPENCRYATVEEHVPAPPSVREQP